MAIYEDMRSDFASVLSEFGQTVTITRTSETMDSMGGVSSTSTTSYDIDAIFQSITEEDRVIHNMGMAEPGNRKVFFKHSYDSDDDASISGTFKPQEGDVLTDEQAIKWEIVEIVKRGRQKSNVIFTKTVARRLE